MLKIHIGAIHHLRVRGLAQGIHRAGHILMVAGVDLAQDILKIRGFALFLQLAQAALGAGLGGGGQVDLDRRVWQHHGADIAAIQQHGLGGGDFLLARLERLLARFGLPTAIDCDGDTLRRYLTHDKKAAGSRITVVVTERPGEGRLEEFPLESLWEDMP